MSEPDTPTATEPSAQQSTSEPDAEQPGTGIPHRVLRDPRALRAMAHPVRLQIMEELARTGQATATELSERIGESAANCSWHLRQLAQYGFIEEAGGGTGRQRPWKVVVQSTTFGRSEEGETELAYASDAAAEVLLERELAAFRAWQASRRGAPEEWRAASFMSQAWYFLTANELATFKQEFDNLVGRTVGGGERIDPAQRPPGARLVRLVTWAVPGGPETESGDPAAHPPT